VSEPLPVLPLEPLSAATFAPFGEVIEAGAARQVFSINEGTAQRYHDLATLDCGAEGGRVIVSLFRAAPRELPFAVRMLERHPLGSQAFVPLDPATRYVAVVASDPGSTPRAFLVDGGRGINLHRGTWHHPLIALDATRDFLVLDRGGPGANCDVLIDAAIFCRVGVRCDRMAFPARCSR
jgi:ureidoglycolate lyase